MATRPRPPSTVLRPNSAIYIGSGPSPFTAQTSIPDLPEPPSPGASDSSTNSGLPSPPATNSTGSGSGSTGDFDSIRQRPNNMDVEDDGEDTTAKFNMKGSSNIDNVHALQRVQSLTQRNRAVLDKLSAFSRASPTPSSRRSRSPQPPPTETPPTYPRRQASYDTVHSGSETERESHHSLSLASHQLAYSSSNEDLLAVHTPPASTRPRSSLGTARGTLHSSGGSTNTQLSESVRLRRTSAPASPAKARERTSAVARANSILQNGSRPGSRFGTRGKRISLLGAGRYSDDEEDPSDDDSRRSHDDGAGLGKRRGDFAELTSRALAAVASARGNTPSPSPSAMLGRKRQPLPREFVEGQKLDPRETRRQSPPPSRIHFPPDTNPPSQTSPRQPKARSSTVRDATRRQTRWLSDDLGNSSPREFGEGTSEAGVGRRQSLRGGSEESPLTNGNGRSLVSEGLRAAGIGRRSDDVFGNGSMRRVDAERDRSHSRAGDYDPQVVSTPENAGARASSTYSSSSRPTTSLSGDRPLKNRYPLPERERDRVGGPSRQGTASPFGTARRGSLTLAAVTNNNTGPSSAREISPNHPGSASFQQSQHTGGGHSEHTRLMLDSLSILESHLSRIPPMGNTTTVTVPELWHSAQGIVGATERLNNLLRAATNRALDEQIDAEIEGDDSDPDQGAGGRGETRAAVWRKVGGEYRESLRVSDEVVRGMTAFLLGVGKVLRDTSSSSFHPSGETPHLKGVSLDEELGYRRSPDVMTNGSGSGRRGTAGSTNGLLDPRDGRRSVESKRSWETSGPGLGTAERRNGTDPLKRLNGRVDSILNGGRPPSAVQMREREMEEREQERPYDLDATPPTPSGGQEVRGPKVAAIRRLFSPREQREQALDQKNGTPPASAPHQEGQGHHHRSLSNTVGDYEPSPTPAPRHQYSRSSLQGGNTRTQTLPSLAIPDPRPPLASESALRRVGTVTDSISHSRQKPSVTSISTVRATSGGISPFPSSRNATTALTPHTVSNSPETTSFPLLRTPSHSSAASHTRNNVTFSKPSPMSVSVELSNLQQEDSRKRTISTLDEGPLLQTQLSGSDSDRDARRRTSTIGVKATSRLSLDQNNTYRSPSDRKEQRRSVTEVFSRR